MVVVVVVLLLAAAAMVVVVVAAAVVEVVVAAVVVVLEVVEESQGMILCLKKVRFSHVLKRRDLWTYGRTDKPSYRDKNEEVDNNDESGK